MHNIKKQCLSFPCLFAYFAFVIFIVASILGCSKNQIPASLTPSFTEPPIPFNYQTYTDETSAFSISYPSDWEVDNFSLDKTEQKVKDTIKKIDSNLPIEKASFIFLAGIPLQGGYEPNVNIGVEPLPNGVKNQDQLADSEISGLKKVSSDGVVLSRIKTKIDGKDASIFEFTGTLPGIPKYHYLSMCLFKGQIVWGVTCTSAPEDFDKWKGDFHSIVRSLRILK
jgi:hypothetical protein